MSHFIPSRGKHKVAMRGRYGSYRAIIQRRLSSRRPGAFVKITSIPGHYLRTTASYRFVMSAMELSTRTCNLLAHSAPLLDIDVSCLILAKLQSSGSNNLLVTAKLQAIDKYCLVAALRIKVYVNLSRRS
ncbi:hypothetical protein J6590_000073 [Homalodisca vitripennis]|nr:hypothetical protein J6590_000073 [Homalodisca vitripennis]